MYKKACTKVTTKRKKRIFLFTIRGHTGNIIITRNVRIIFPKVSIVILSYNNPFVRRAVLTVLLKSSYSNIEDYYVDNGSDLETISVLNTYAQKYSGMLKLIRNKSNKGFQQEIIEDSRNLPET